MKNYTITVNGNIYDVTVEENGEGQQGTPVQKTAPAPKAAPSASALKAAPQGTQGTVKVNSPMPGKVIAIKASQGQAVKKGEVILVLEAMKMENEIVAPQDGSIASINAAAGDNVEAGAILATLN